MLSTSYATKADLAELKIDVNNRLDDLVSALRWFTGISVAVGATIITATGIIVAAMEGMI